MIRRLLPVYLVLLIIVSLVSLAWLIWGDGTIWSPLDEIAHYDYIHELSTGRVPHPKEFISDHTLGITLDYFGFPAGMAKYDGAKESLGAMGRSYEAQQPPVYYLLMAAPDAMLERAGVSPPTVIRLLRSVNILFYGGAAFFIVLAYRDLSPLCGLPPVYGYFVAFFATAVRYLFRYQLDSDHLSALLGAACVYLAIHLWRTRDHRYVAWSGLAAVLAVLTKYTNGLLLLGWLLNTLFYYERAERPRARIRLRHAAPLLLLPLYFGINAWLYGWGDILKTKDTMEYFRHLVTPAPAPNLVVGSFLNNSVSLEPKWTQPIPFLYLLLLVILVNYGLSFFRLFLLDDKSVLPLFVATQTAGLILLACMLLNAWVTTVDWRAFRYFEGYDIFWYTALTATPLLIGSRLVRIAAAGAGALLAGAMVYIWL